MPQEPKHIVFDQDKGEPWVTTYHLGYDEFDDDLEDNDTQEIIFNAPDFNIAIRYAQQYLRKMQTEEETAEKWKNASIMAVELH